MFLVPCFTSFPVAYKTPCNSSSICCPCNDVVNLLYQKKTYRN
nr:MAG TPA: hypothetical protein [Caudoviricetes sp.]